MIGDRPIALLAFFAAALLHLVLFMLASYMPLATPKRPAPPSRTRYVVQFQQPTPTATPTAVPKSAMPASPMTPVLPVPDSPLPRQLTPAPEPVRIAPPHTQATAIEVQRPTSLPQPVERQAQPRQPAQSKAPVRVPSRRELPTVAVAPRLKSIDPIKRPKRVVARKPADVNVRPTKRTAAAAPRAPSRPAAPSPQPAAPALQDLQQQYLAVVSAALRRYKHYPRMARRRGLSGKVVLDFVILPNGHITESRIVASQSTRHSILNQAALRALKRASPLPPFPKALDEPSLRVTLPILYELTER